MASMKIRSRMILDQVSRSKPHKKLDFDSCSEEDMPRSSSPERDNRKKLVFDFLDDDALDFELSDPPSSPAFKSKACLVNSGLSPIELRSSNNIERNQFDSPLSVLQDLNDSVRRSPSDKFSPCRTRSGRIYTSVEKKRNNKSANSSISKSTSTGSKLPTPVFLDAPRSSSRHNSGASAEPATPRSSKIPASQFRVQELQLNLLQKDLSADLMDFDDLPSCNEPPPINHNKRPISRLLHLNVDTSYDNISSPYVPKTPANLHSPPTNEVKAMRLFDPSPVLSNSPVTAFTAPRLGLPKNRILFGLTDDQPRRYSAPPVGSRVTFDEDSSNKERKRKRVANINPFTPTSMLASLNKRFKSENEILHTNHSFGSPNFEDELRRFGHPEAGGDQDGPHPAKRLRVSDIDISRYEKEFVEIKEIASGSFGKVKVARHCLDGMVYAIKVTRNKIHCNTHEERVAMNEVFAHAALMKHKHVVRYYNSWVENGHVYIQNEYCEGGSLGNLIKEYRKMGRRFPEGELKRIVMHIAKGLQYVHSKQLVHLDIKPENIFISLDHITPSPTSAKTLPKDAAAPSPSVQASNKSHQVANAIEPSKIRGILDLGGDCSGNESTDSGNASGCDVRLCFDSQASTSSTTNDVDERISYKIGDLGHVSPIYGDTIPEEGDCRYMAPELLADDVLREVLAKADIFSLGLTLYEAASLQELPKNSLEDPMYERIKAGDLPYLEGYSKEFNQLMKSMVSSDPNLRPSASKIVSHPYLRSNSMSKSRFQLCKELNEMKARVKQLELEILGNVTATPRSGGWLTRFNPKSKVGAKGDHQSSSPQTSPTAVRVQAVGTKSRAKDETRFVGRGTPKSYSCLL